MSCIPTGAYNAPQMLKNLNTTKAGRDFGYVEEIHLNALRVRASYEYWRMGSARFQTELVRSVIHIFSGVGGTPSFSPDPRKAFDVQSPARNIAASDKSGWEEARKMIKPAYLPP